MCFRFSFHCLSIVSNIFLKYNGYSWLGDEKVFNPYSVGMLFSRLKFSDYWVTSGTPGWPFRSMKKLDPIDLVSETFNVKGDFQTVELDSLGQSMFTMKQLLLQAGYLTIIDQKMDPSTAETLVKLGSPNMEVRKAVQSQVFKTVFNSRVDQGVTSNLELCFKKGDVDGFVKAANGALATIPYNTLKRATKVEGEKVLSIEKYWASAMIMLVHALPFKTTPHVLRSKGEIDVEFEDENQIWIIEWKVVREKKYKSKVDEKMSQKEEERGNRILILIFLSY